MSMYPETIRTETPSARETLMPMDWVRFGGRSAAVPLASVTGRTALEFSKLKDLVSLTKPEVLMLVLIATGAGCAMASPSLDWHVLFHAVLGTALVAGGAAALNHYLERTHDAKMRRTAQRPLPAGRLTAREALGFGVGWSLAGTIYLARTVNVLTCVVGLGALLSYLLLYTPLKRRTALCTLIGAFPGAAPVLMGWTAARGDLALGGWVLYTILFFWQFPHFLAIGWMYREDYARAGMRMIPNAGGATFHGMWITSLALIAVTPLPSIMGLTGAVYLYTALGLGLGLLYFVYRAATERTNAAAKRLLHATVIYLPLLFLVMVLDK